MPAPDFYVQTVSVQQDYDVLLATDQLFMVGLTEKGPTTPQRHTDIEAWADSYGAAVAFSQMREEAELFFREGGRNLITQRVVGPAPLKASTTLSNSTGDPVIKLEALDYGVYGNSITRTVTAGTGSAVIITMADASGTLQTSPDLTTQAEIVDYFATSKYVRATALTGTGLPAPVTSAALSGGTDDHANAVDANYQTGLDALDRRLGPGQVSMPGRTTDEARAQLRLHATTYDRIPFGDLADTANASTLSAAITDEHDAAGSGAMGLFVPWVINPDGAELPPSVFAAAKVAAKDLETGNPNEAAAGENGQAVWITGLTQDFTDADRAALAAASINVIRDVDLQGTLQIFDFVTINQDDPLLDALSNARLDMRLRWHARKVARPLLFKQIDPQGHLASRYNGVLDAMLKSYKDLGALFDYVVDTQSVNTRETAAAKQLNAKIGVQRSPFSRFVYLTINNYQLTDSLTGVAA